MESNGGAVPGRPQGLFGNLEGVAIAIAEAAGLDRHKFDRGEYGQVPEGLA